jgi:hypothetical protein
MKKLFAFVSLAVFFLFSLNTLVACKQKPKEEAAIEEGTGTTGEIEPKAVTPAPAPAEESAPEEAGTPTTE